MYIVVECIVIEGWILLLCTGKRSHLEYIEWDVVMRTYKQVN